jgi:hypothetical protein
MENAVLRIRVLNVILPGFRVTHFELALQYPDQHCAAGNHVLFGHREAGETT